MSRKKRDNEIEIVAENVDDGNFSLIADFNEGGFKYEEDEFTGMEMPVLPLRNMVLFPTTVLPVSVGRESSLKLIRKLEKSKGVMAVVCQRDPSTDDPGLEDLYPVGTTARIIRVFDLPDHSTTVILQGLQRIELKDIVRTSPYLIGEVDSLSELQPVHDDEFKLLIKSCRESALKIFKSSENLAEASFAVKNMEDGAPLVNFLCANIKMPLREKMSLLCEGSVSERAYHLLAVLDHEKQLAEIQQKIQQKTHKDLDQQQREYYLQQQIKNIQEELGGSIQDQDIMELRRKANGKAWSNETEETFEKELMKLERINPQSPDYHVQLNYLQLFVSLPWGEHTDDNLDISNARKVLDKDHYGLEKVKERILEHLAVIKMRGDL